MDILSNPKYHANQEFEQLIPETPVGRHGLPRSPIGPLVVLFIVISIEISLFIFTLETDYWFTYCNWNFSLNHVKNSSLYTPKTGDENYSITEFYHKICDPDKDLFPQCPHLCESIKPLKSSMVYVSWFGWPALIVAFSVLVIAILQRNKHIKVNMKCMYALNLLPLVLYICGFALYYAESGFEKHFYNTHSSPNDHDYSNFAWGWGLIISIIIMCVMSCNFMTSRSSIGSYYRN